MARVRLLRVRPLLPLKAAIAKRFGPERTPAENEVAPARVSAPELFGMVTRNWREPLGLSTELTGKYGSVVRGRLPTGHELFVVADSEGIDSVLKGTDRGEDSPFEKSELLADPLASFAGRRGMFTNTGGLWARQRKELSFFFRPTRIQEGAMAGEMHEVIGARVDDLRRRIADPRRTSPTSVHLDLADELSDLTLEVLLKTLFHPRTVGPEERARARTAFKEIAAAVPYDIVNPVNVGISRLPPVTARQLRLRAAYKVMDDLVDRVVHDRVSQPRAGEPDALDSMLDTVDEGRTFREAMKSGAPIPRELRDQILTMVLAGHETTAASLSFAFHELARSPDTMQRLRGELERLPPARGDPDAARRTIMMLAHGKELPFMGQVVDETLRLYSPAWAVARRAKTDTYVALRDGKTLFVPKDAQVLMPLFVSQRLDATWGTEKTGFPADKFHPERFDPANLAAHGLEPADVRFTPFGAGRRVCLGEHFATLETRLILAEFLRAFDVRPENGGDPKLTATIALRIAGGMPATLTLRDPAH